MIAACVADDLMIFLLILCLFPSILTGAVLTNYFLQPGYFNAINLWVKDIDTSEHGVISGSKKSGTYTWSASKAMIDDLGAFLPILLGALLVPSITFLVIMGLGFQLSRFLFNIFLFDEKDYLENLVLVNMAGLIFGIVGRIGFEFFVK